LATLFEATTAEVFAVFAATVEVLRTTPAVCAFIPTFEAGLAVEVFAAVAFVFAVLDALLPLWPATACADATPCIAAVTLPTTRQKIDPEIQLELRAMKGTSPRVFSSVRTAPNT
jgi:hypothetical protein